MLNMFSAKNARDLKKSFSTVTQEVFNITQGIENLILSDPRVSDYYHVMGSARKGSFTPEILTTFMTDVVHQLKLLGYDVVWEWEGDPYVPRGLQDDDGNGTMYDYFGIRITWGE